MLGRIIQLLEQRGMAGAADIAAELDASHDAVVGMLETLQRKGVVLPYQAPQGCGSQCRQCPGAAVRLYCLARNRATMRPVSTCSLVSETPKRG